jgi:sialate O-acetylesterase
MAMKPKGRFLLFVFLALLPGKLPANLRMPAIFSDNMVLQRETTVRVWGWADPGQRVAVTLGDQKKVARAGRDGSWEVSLSPMKAGGPYRMNVEGRTSLQFSNILIGDVWLCSGQSNMEWPVSLSAEPDLEISNAVYPEIRLFTVPRHMAASPQNDLAGGRWEECSPRTIHSFSAAGYFFGRDIHRETGVPVGLIQAAWGGTVAETWISGETMASIGDFRELMQRRDNSDLERLQAEAVKLAADWDQQAEVSDAGLINNWHDPMTDCSGWEKMRLPVLWEQAGLPGLDGVVWFRKEILLSREETGGPLTLGIGPVDDSDYTWFNGQLIGETTDRYSDVRIYTVDAGYLREGRNVIAVRVIDTGGGGGIWGKEDQMYYQSAAGRISLAGDWGYAVGMRMDPRPGGASMSGPNSFPTLLYNGMINPVTRFALKGVIWYQGESNAGRAYQYREIFPSLIADWRKQWEKADMPFIFVQLANFMAPVNEPSESGWAELREAQAMALSLPATGMAVAIDIGEADDIHPLNKQDVGKRLAISALKVAYGRDIVHSGPVCTSMSIEGDRIWLSFASAGSGLMVADRYGYLKGFAIAGEDRKFHWARAFIENDRVVVYSERVKKPVAVRYAWGDNPHDANLYNIEGLPALPFRTDDWPGITFGVK